MKNLKGITLIALVITIVVLIILAGVAINLSMGENGLFNKAKLAKEEYTNAQGKEEAEIMGMNKKIDEYAQLDVATDGTVNLNMQQLKSAVLDMVYPVGSIYITTDNENPSTTLGGTWEKYSQGRTLIGDGIDNEGDANGDKVAFVAGNKGGEYNHQLSVAEMPAHTHQYVDRYSYNLNNTSGACYNGINCTWSFHWSDANKNTASSGGSESHNNIQPYIVTYIWKRTQ